MKLWTIIPVKTLGQTKSRLGRVLSSEARAQLTQRLLTRTLHLLQAVPAVAETAVISQDPIIAAIARQHGVRYVPEPAGSGLNGAVATGAALATANGATHLLILPSDLPFLNVGELNEWVEWATAVPHPTLFICSDRQQQGTNGMILPTGWGFRFQYGRNSFHLHENEAARLGLPCQISPLPSCQFDLDSEQDYAFYQENRLANVV